MASPATPKNISNKKTHLQNVIEIPASPFMQKIGYGTGVAVYTLVRSPLNRSPWAVKKLLKGKRKTDKAVEHRLKIEADILKQISHPNIVGYRGYLKNVEGQNVLAMEKCKHCLGDLIEEMRDGEEQSVLKQFSTKVIGKMCIDIARALDYLHNSVFLMHCDVKSFNILINGNYDTFKLCDFGVCRPVNKDGDMITDHNNDFDYPGTSTWSPPEVFNLPPIITTKADIYSYGLVIWEMLALDIPYYLEDEESELSSNESFLSDDNVIVKRTRPPIPGSLELGSEYSKILELFLLCTEPDWGKRVTVKNVVTFTKEYFVDIC